jgi:hypothetical protein
LSSSSASSLGVRDRRATRRAVISSGMHFRRSRCLIPASAYYEWQDTATGKQPWYFTPADGDRSPSRVYGMSGKTRRLARSCTMIITEPSDFVAEVHDRMPVILARSSFAKGALQNHICRFESCMLSQPVRSSLCDFRVCENRRHSRGLGWRAGASSRHILEFRLWIGGFAVPVSARHFPISVSAYPRPVRYVTETGLRSRISPVRPTSA